MPEGDDDGQTSPVCDVPSPDIGVAGKNMHLFRVLVMPVNNVL